MLRLRQETTGRGEKPVRRMCGAEQSTLQDVVREAEGEDGMEKMSDKELTQALRTLAQAMDEMPGGYGHNTAEPLRAAADRIVQLAQANHDIRHLWYKDKEMCEICAHRCTNTEVDYCSDCDRECMCMACEGECWEEQSE